MPAIDLEIRLQQFMTRYHFDDYKLDHDFQDLVFVDRGQEFVSREYVKGSPIRNEWEELEDEVFDQEA